MSVTVTGTAQAKANLQKYVETLRQNAQAAMEEIAALLSAYAKANHPWANDTGETERTTQAGITEITSALIRVTLTTGTDYSKFLELCHEGKWAWLWPTLLACEDDIKRILTARLGSRAAGFSLSRGATSL